MPERQTSPAEVSPDEADPSTANGRAPDAEPGSAPAPTTAQPRAAAVWEPPQGPAGAAHGRESHLQDVSRPEGGFQDDPGSTDVPSPIEDHADDDRATDVLAGDNRATDVLAPVDEPPGDGATEEPTAEQRPPADDDEPTVLIPAAATRGSRRRRRVLLLTGVVVALLAGLYVVDLVRSAGTVPRGVTVAGQEIGGLTPAEAERRVRAAVEPRTVRPVDVAVDEVTSQIDPRTAGLSVDWAATIRQAGAQPLNPITRVRSFFTRRDVGVVTTADPDAVDAAVAQLVPVVNRPPVEGTVRFEGVTPVPVPPVDGRNLDLAAARQVLERDWANGTTVRLPTAVLTPATTSDDVARAVTAVAAPAVSGPVTVVGENVTGTLTPEVIAKALSFQPDPGQGLAPELDKAVISDALDPQLAKSEQPGRDASLRFPGPVVTPSQDGRGVDYDATLKELVPVLTRTGDERRVTAVYAAQPAKLTTDELNALGIKEVIGEFTTAGFAVDSGRNIRRAAQVINGAIIKPGETFSLNQATEPRDAAHGYVEAGVIQDGHASRDIGGGVSQVATTLYNAAYFAGMTDVVHKPHSFYISRYPPGREATVVSGPLDLKFRNDNDTGAMIQTVWTPTTLTVRIYGTKRYDVTSAQGPRTNPTDPTKVEIPAGEPCTPSQGAPGFTISDTRTLRDVRTGAVRTEKRTTKYNPAPIVSCKDD